MAGTFTVEQKTVFGNMRVLMGVMDAADGATAAIDTGLETVLGFTVTPLSCTTGGGVQFTKSGGNITPVTCDSGDTYQLIAYGI